MIKKIALLFSIIVLTTTSCSKYEFGPAISLISRTNRLAESWGYTNVYRNGLDISTGTNSLDQIYTQSSIGFAIDGRFSHSDVFRDSVTVRGDGSWEFIENDEKLQLIYDDNTVRILNITRLERSFLWLKEEFDGNNTVEFRLAPND